MKISYNIKKQDYIDFNIYHINHEIERKNLNKIPLLCRGEYICQTLIFSRRAMATFGCMAVRGRLAEE